MNTVFSPDRFTCPLILSRSLDARLRTADLGGSMAAEMSGTVERRWKTPGHVVRNKRDFILSNNEQHENNGWLTYLCVRPFVILCIRKNWHWGSWGWGWHPQTLLLAGLVCTNLCSPTEKQFGNTTIKSSTSWLRKPLLRSCPKKWIPDTETVIFRDACCSNMCSRTKH